MLFQSVENGDRDCPFTPANPMPPWTPQVWRDGPDGIVAQATQSLFADQTEITNKVLGATSSTVAMSGSDTNPENETDQLIDTSTPGDSPSHGPSTNGRAAQWSSMMNDLRRDEPLANWSDGSKDGPANPAP